MLPSVLPASTPVSSSQVNERDQSTYLFLYSLSAGDRAVIIYADITMACVFTGARFCQRFT